MSDAGEVLKEAQRIVTRGWCKGTAHDSGRHCVLGAVWEAQRRLLMGNTEAGELLNRLSPVSEEEANAFGLQRAAAFNDHPATVLSDIVTFFDKALAELGEL